MLPISSGIIGPLRAATKCSVFRGAKTSPGKVGMCDSNTVMIVLRFCYMVQGGFSRLWCCYGFYSVCWT